MGAPCGGTVHHAPSVYVVVRNEYTQIEAEGHKEQVQAPSHQKIHKSECRRRSVIVKGGGTAVPAQHLRMQAEVPQMHVWHGSVIDDKDPLEASASQARYPGSAATPKA